LLNTISSLLSLNNCHERTDGGVVSSTSWPTIVVAVVIEFPASSCTPRISTVKPIIAAAVRGVVSLSVILMPLPSSALAVPAISLAVVFPVSLTTNVATPGTWVIGSSNSTTISVTESALAATGLGGVLSWDILTVKLYSAILKPAKSLTSDKEIATSPFGSGEKNVTRTAFSSGIAL